VPAVEAARPGDKVWVAIPLHMDSGWHTYWRNPGDSGMPISIKWTLPSGITAGDIRWPQPEKMSEAGINTYIYKNDATLLVPLTLASDLKPGPVELKAKVSWLECEVQCVPGEATVTATLNIGSETKSGKAAEEVSVWQKILPANGNAPGAVAWWEAAGTNNSRALVLQWNAAAGVTDADFFPDANDDFDVQAATEKIPAAADKIRIRKQVKKSADEWPKEISGLLVQKIGGVPQSYEVKLPVAQTPPAESKSAGSIVAPVNTIAPPSLWKMLLYAFIGGLILNIMPCVLPVIALKILGFVGQAKDNPRRVRKLGLLYAAGMLISFLTLWRRNSWCGAEGRLGHSSSDCQS